MTKGPSVNFPCVRETFRELPSTFRTDQRTSVCFRECSLRPGDLTSTCVNILWSWKTFRQLPAIFRVVRKWSVNFRLHFVRPIHHQSTFHSARGPSVKFLCGRGPSINFRQLSVMLGDLPSTSVIFTCGRCTFHELLSTFHAAGRPLFNFRQIFVQP